MSILNISSSFGILNLFKTWSPAPGHLDATPVRPAEVPARRTRTAPAMLPHDPDRFFEEDCERWDGLS
jgi:hypothetical protein